MTRRAARVTHDEICRTIKAAQTMGLSIGNIVIDRDGALIIGIKSGDSGEIVPALTVQEPPKLTPIREPKL